MDKIVELNSFDISTPTSLLKKIKKKFIISPWIDNTLKKIKFKKKYKFPLNVVEVNLRNDLNFKNPAYLYKVHKELKKMVLI